MPENPTWSAPECPFVIEYAPRALDDIRLAVTDAFFSLPRGGAEIGGILLGKWEDGRLTISDYAALDCEHAFGPSFNLSDPDRARLADLIASVSGDLRPVGWYHSHTRSEIFLSGPDLQIHDKFFKEPWQVALVLKPHTFLPARAGFFFRQPDGSIHGQASYREFTLEPLTTQPVPVGAPGIPGISPASEVVVDILPPLDAPPAFAGPDVEAVVVHDLPPVTVDDASAAVIHAADVPGVPPAPVSDQDALYQTPSMADHDAPPTSDQDLSPIADHGPAPVAVHDPRPTEDEMPPAAHGPETIPNFLMRRPPSPRRWPKVVVPLALCASIAAAAFWKRDLWIPRVMAMTRPAPVPAAAPPLGIGLNTLDLDGQLQIRWNRNSPAVLEASAGVLTVTGGAAPSQEIPLDHAHLLSGIVTLARQSERVDVALTLTKPGAPSIREGTSFIGKLPEPKPTGEDPAAQREREALASQMSKLKSDLELEVQRNRKLQKSVDFITKQLRDQQRARLLNQAPDKK